MFWKVFDSLIACKFHRMKRSSYLIGTLLLMGAIAMAAPMGIDLGTEFIKVASVKNGNVDIVLNEQSHRKSHNFVGFRLPERYFAEEAKNFAARFPDNMIGAVNRMVGLRGSDDIAGLIASTLGLYYNLTEDSTGTVRATFGTGSGQIAFTAEQVLGMMFAHIRLITEKDLGETSREAVVTVPNFFTPRQSQAIINAAAIGGVKVLSLIQSTTATALQYGIQQRGFDNETIVMIYDMGTSKTEATIVKYSPPKTGLKKSEEKKIPLSQRLGTMKVLRQSALSTLGGRTFDFCIADIIEAAFEKESKQDGPSKSAATSLAARKGMVSLLRAANKAKEILGANKLAAVTVEGILPDRDFSMQLTRTEFEEKCDAHFKKAAALVKQLIEESGVPPEEIATMELMGGATRVPKLIEELEAAFGRTVGRTINADEAAALGAAFYAAAASDSIRVKSFALQDIFPRNISFSLSKRPDSDEEVSVRPLFVQAVAPSRKSVSVARNEDFNLTVMTATDDGERVEDFTVLVSGVQKALRGTDYYNKEKGEDGTVNFLLAHENNSHTIKIELRASESNTVTVEKASITIRYAVNATKKVLLNETELEELAAKEKEAAEKKEESAADAENAKAESEDDGEISDESSGDKENEADAESAKSDIKTKKTEKTKTSKKPTKKYKQVPVTEMRRKLVDLTVDIVYAEPRPMSSDEIAVSRKLLKELSDVDKQKRLIAAARNDIEAYLLYVKGDGVLENQELLDKLGEENVTAIKEAVERIGDWYESAPDKTSVDGYKAKLSELRTVVKKNLPKAKEPKAKKTTPTTSSKPKKETASGSKKKASSSSQSTSKKAESKKTESKKASKPKPKPKKKEPEPDTTEEL